MKNKYILYPETSNQNVGKHTQRKSKASNEKNLIDTFDLFSPIQSHPAVPSILGHPVHIFLHPILSFSHVSRLFDYLVQFLQLFRVQKTRRRYLTRIINEIKITSSIGKYCEVNAKIAKLLSFAGDR